jgi:hypothetical protein
VCTNRSDRNPALSFRAGIVALSKSLRIVKHEYGSLEANAMFAKIVTILVFIPDKSIDETSST